MSLGSGPMSPKRWRPWEQIGWGMGVAAGAVAPLCLWAFTIVWRVAQAVAPARPGRGPRSAAPRPDGAERRVAE